MKEYTNKELQARLESCEATISEYRGYGGAWALDCRDMQIAQSNAMHIRTEIHNRREAGTWEQPVQQNEEDGKIEENPNQDSIQGDNMSSFNTTTIQTLIDMGVMKQSDADKLEKKLARANVKLLKEARQSFVNGQVKAALTDIEEGTLFKHRAVWESVGREAFERDEVLKALRFWQEELEVQQIRKGPNNFQVFWCRGDEKVEEVVEAPVEAS